MCMCEITKQIEQKGRVFTSFSVCVFDADGVSVNLLSVGVRKRLSAAACICLSLGLGETH